MPVPSGTPGALADAHGAAPALGVPAAPPVGVARGLHREHEAHAAGVSRRRPVDAPPQTEAGRGRPGADRATFRNERWSMDVVLDALADGWKVRALTIVDEFPRECPAIEVDHSLIGARVVRVLVCKYTPIPAVREQAKSRTRCSAVLMSEQHLRIQGGGARASRAVARGAPRVRAAGSSGHRCAGPGHDGGVDPGSPW